ncbi:MAG: ABC-2 family transporter protein [Acidimicrobiales bacterium]
MVEALVQRRRLWPLYRRLVGARIRSAWQYRTSFLTFAIAQAMVTTLEFSALVILVSLVPSLGGWTRPEVALLYALAALPFGLADLFVSSVDRVPQYVQAGTFDRVLLRPMPALFQMSALEFELRRVGKAVPPFAVLLWALPTVDVVWTIGRVATLAMALVCGTMIYAALWIGTASAAFWIVATEQAANAVTYGGEFANEYPLHLYRPAIRLVLGWAIPLAFVAYVPSQHLLDAANPLGMPSWLIWATPLVAVATLGVAMLAWAVGIRHYQSTGS